MVALDSEVSLCLTDGGGIYLPSVQTACLKLTGQLLRHRIRHQFQAMRLEEAPYISCHNGLCLGGTPWEQALLTLQLEEQLSVGLRDLPHVDAPFSFSFLSL